MSVRKLLKAGGVAEVFRHAGIRMDEEYGRLAEACGSDLAKAWQGITHPVVMLNVANLCDVNSEILVDAARVVLERVIVETGANQQHPLASEFLASIVAVLEDPESDQESQAGQRLTELAGPVRAWILGPKEESGVPSWWLPMMAGLMGLAQAAVSIRCQCPVDHDTLVRESVDSCCMAATIARSHHGRHVGRVPEGTSTWNAMGWSAAITANVIRELIPVDVLLVPHLDFGHQQGRGQA